MVANSAISWTTHTFNGWWGCFKVSEGCRKCYAETFAKRTGRSIWGPPAAPAAGRPAAPAPGGAMSAYTVGSLFSGCGGFDMAFAQAGFDVRWHAEIDKDAEIGRAHV